MPITASPETMSAIPERIFNQWWLISLNIIAMDPNGMVQAMATFRLMRRDDNGVAEFHPTEMPKQLVINDLFALAASNDTVNTLVTGVIDTVGALAKAQNVIE